MAKLTASQKRLIDNAVLITALKLIFTQLEKLGFPIYKLKQIANTTSGGTPSRRVPSYYGGDIPWIKSGELNDGLIKQAEEHITEQALNKSSAKIYSKGTVVIALYGATVGKTGILEIDAASNQAVCAVLPKTDEVSKNFLFWFLRNKRQDFLNDSFGGAQPNISQKVLKDTDIVIPDKKNQENICQFLKIVEQRQNGDKTIDLPDLPIPLNNIKDTVATVEELAGKIEEARSLREQTIKKTKSFVTSLHLSLSGSRIVKLDKILNLDEHRETVEFGKEYPQVGVRGFGGGLFAKESINATQTSYKAFNRLYNGAIVLSQVKGWEGAISVCSSKLADKYVSPEYRTFSCIPAQAIPEYLAVLFAAPWFWTKLKNITRGMGGRRERTRPEQFLQMELPMPTVDQQRQALSVLKKLEPMQHLREKALQELDALLPSILDKAFKGEL